MTAPIRPSRSLYDEYLEEQRHGAHPDPKPDTPGGSLYAEYLAEQHAAPTFGENARDFTRALLGQGLAAGFGDEIEGGARSLVDIARGEAPLSAYQRERDAIRTQNKDFATRNPKTAVGAEIVGGLAGMLVPVGEAARVAGAGARIARAARTGAVVGGAYGLGKAEGDALTQAKSTAEGALAGTVLGGVTQTAGEGVRRIAQAANATPRLWNAAAKLPLGERVRQFMQKRAATALDAAADRNVAERLVQDETTPAEAAAFVRDAPEHIRVAVADAGGENTRQGYAALKRLPGKQKDAITKAVDARDASAPTWMRRSIRAHTENDAAALGLDPAAVDTRSTNPNTLVRTAKDALDVRSTARYEPALMGPTVYDAPAAKTLGGLLKRPSMQKAVKFGSELAQESGDELPAVTIDPATGAASGPTAKQLHWLKVGLDEHIADLTARSGSGANMRLRSAMQAKEDLLGVIGKLAPDYADAMTAHADEVAPITGFAQGRKMPTTTLPEDVETRLADARNDNARTALGAGYARKLGNEVGRAQRSNGNPIKPVVGSGAADDPMVQNLRQLLPGAAPKIERDAAIIQRVLRTDAAVKGNSSSIERGMENAAQAKKLVQRVFSGAKALGGRPMEFLNDVLGGTYGPEAQLAAQKLTLGANVGERDAAVRYLEDLQRKTTVQRVLRGSRQRSLTGAASGYTAGSASAKANSP